jgi:hypothetical protein
MYVFDVEIKNAKGRSCSKNPFKSEIFGELSLAPQ